MVVAFFLTERKHKNWQQKKRSIGLKNVISVRMCAHIFKEI